MNPLLDAKSLVERFYSLGEAQAGSESEHSLAEELARLLEQVGVPARLLKPSVAYWRDEGGYVEAGARVYQGVSLPQVAGGCAEGRLVEAKDVDLEEVSKAAREGDIVLVEEPEDPDELSTAYMSALEVGASGLVVYSRYPRRLRRIVVTGRWDYSFRMPAPALIPAVYLRREDGLELRRYVGYTVRVCANSRIGPGTGYIVEGQLGCETCSYLVLITAHHDHWLGGANDNLAGAAGLVLLAARLKSRVRGDVCVRFVCFTAEELGDPLLPSWYWCYGSRWYARQLRYAGQLDSVIAVLNMDVAATPGTVEVHATGYELQKLLEELASSTGLGRIVVRGFDSCYTDSFSFSALGVPSASAISLDPWVEYYHTDLDTPEKLDYNTLTSVVELYTKAVEVLVEKKLRAYDYVYYAKRLYQQLAEKRAPPLSMRSGYRLLRETIKAVERGDWEALYNAYRLVNMECVKPVFHGDYRFDEGKFVTIILPELLAIEQARKVMLGEARDPSKVKPYRIPGWEEELPTPIPYPPPRGVREKERILEEAKRIAVYVIQELDEAIASKLDNAYYALLHSRVKPPHNTENMDSL